MMQNKQQTAINPSVSKLLEYAKNQSGMETIGDCIIFTVIEEAHVLLKMGLLSTKTWQKLNSVSGGNCISFNFKRTLY